MQTRFKLVRYFATTSLAAFCCVAAALIYFQTSESALVESVQAEEARTVQEMQALLVSRADEAARRDLLAAHEGSNVNLARLLSHAMWEDALQPFLAASRGIDFSHCRVLKSVGSELAEPARSAQTRTCLQQQGASMQALPHYAALDARLRHAVRGSSVARIQIHSLHGITLYSTDPAHLGEDQSAHPGWMRASRVGQPVSELSFQKRFNALQGPVEDRDLIASHLPLIEPGTGNVIGVFEVHSDVTAHLDQIQQTSADFHQMAAGNQARLARQALDNRNEVRSSERVQLLVLAGLLALLYAVLHSIVRRAQSVIEKQAQESDANKQRLAQSEKMTSLGQMVAGVAHQLNTPLAFSKSNVFMAIQALGDMTPGIHGAARMLDQMTASTGDALASQPQDLDTESVRSQLRQYPGELRMTQDMLGDVLMGLDQMNELVDNLRSFTRLDRSRTTQVDLNTTLASVVYLAKAVISTKIKVVQKFSALPPLECHVSQLNQVFLNLIMNAAQAIDGAGVVTVSTAAIGQRIRITIEDTGSGIADDILPRIFDPYFTTKPVGTGTGLGLAIAKDIVVEHGGTIAVQTRWGIGTTFQVELPLRAHPAA